MVNGTILTSKQQFWQRYLATGTHKKCSILNLVFKSKHHVLSYSACHYLLAMPVSAALGGEGGGGGGEQVVESVFWTECETVLVGQGGIGYMKNW